MLIEEYHWAIVKLSNESEKLVHFKPNSEVNLGKFAKVKVAEFFGKPYHTTLELTSEGKLVVNKNESFEHSVIEEVERAADDSDNRNLLDDTGSQKLTLEEIERMKKEMSGHEIVENLVSNSATFASKTEFSKTKYLKRKRMKFLKLLFVQPVLASHLCSYFYQKDRKKIMELRIDALSQIMMMANVHPGSKCLVLDESRGLVSLAILERLGGEGLLTALHEQEQHLLDLIQYGRVDKSVFHPLCFKNTSTPIDDKFNDREFPDAESRERALDRFNKRIQALQLSQTTFLSTKYESLIICSFQYNPIDIINHLIGSMAGSSNIVIYHPFKDPLLAAYFHCRKSNSFLDVQLTECLYRQYQPICGKIHPEMQTSGNSGFILSMVHVLQ